MTEYHHHRPPLSPLASPPPADSLQEGDPIPGSRYFRHFCPECGSAMRVTRDAINKPLWCESCRGRTPAGQILKIVGNPHPPVSRADREYHGGGAGAAGDV